MMEEEPSIKVPSLCEALECVKKLQVFTEANKELVPESISENTFGLRLCLNRLVVTRAMTQKPITHFSPKL